MTVQVSQFSTSFVGDGVTVTFPLPFPFIEQDHLEARKYPQVGPRPNIVRIVSSTGASLRSGWSVTLEYPIPVGSSVTITRYTSRFQPKVYSENDAFPARSHEIGLDRLTMMIQELSSTYYTDTATFTEGLDAELVAELLPGRMGYATDTEALLLKLADGSVVRFPVNTDDPSVQGYREGYHSESVWNSTQPIALNRSSYKRGTNAFTYEDFEAGGVLCLEWVGELNNVGATNPFFEFYLGDNRCGQLSVEGYTPGQDIKVRLTARIRSSGATTPGIGLPYLSLQSETTIEFFRTDSGYSDTPTVNTRHWGMDQMFLGDVYTAQLVINRDVGAGKGFLQYTFDAYFDNLGGGAGNTVLIGSAGGDLSGEFPTPQVEGIKGNTIPTLSSGYLAWNGTGWEFSDPNTADYIRAFHDYTGEQRAKIILKSDENTSTDAPDISIIQRSAGNNWQAMTMDGGKVTFSLQNIAPDEPTLPVENSADPDIITSTYGWDGAVVEELTLKNDESAALLSSDGGGNVFGSGDIYTDSGIPLLAAGIGGAAGIWSIASADQINTFLGKERLIYSDNGHVYASALYGSESMLPDNTDTRLKMLADSLIHGSKIRIEQVLILPGDSSGYDYEFTINTSPIPSDTPASSPFYANLFNQILSGDAKLVVDADIVITGETEAKAYCSWTLFVDQGDHPANPYPVTGIDVITFNPTVDQWLDIRVNPQSAVVYIQRHTKIYLYTP